MSPPTEIRDYVVLTLGENRVNDLPTLPLILDFTFIHDLFGRLIPPPSGGQVSCDDTLDPDGVLKSVTRSV